jgi:hypothetical protein
VILALRLSLQMTHYWCKNSDTQYYFMRTIITTDFSGSNNCKQNGINRPKDRGKANNIMVQAP